jgi:hypothetical protein
MSRLRLAGQPQGQGDPVQSFPSARRSRPAWLLSRATVPQPSICGQITG